MDALNEGWSTKVDASLRTLVFTVVAESLGINGTIDDGAKHKRMSELCEVVQSRGDMTQEGKRTAVAAFPPVSFLTQAGAAVVLVRCLDKY